MTHPSGPHEGLTPTTQQRSGQVTDTDLNEALESGNLDNADLNEQEIRHDEGAQPDSGRNDAPQPPTRESRD